MGFHQRLERQVVLSVSEDIFLFKGKSLQILGPHQLAEYVFLQMHWSFKVQKVSSVVWSVSRKAPLPASKSHSYHSF